MPARPARMPKHRVSRVKPNRRVSNRPSSTYASNSLRTPTVSRPGAGIGGGKGRTHQSTKQQPKVKRKGYKNYKIDNRNPMED